MFYTTDYLPHTLSDLYKAMVSVRDTQALIHVKLKQPPQPSASPSKLLHDGDTQQSISPASALHTLKSPASMRPHHHIHIWLTLNQVTDAWHPLRKFEVPCRKEQDDYFCDQGLG